MFHRLFFWSGVFCAGFFILVWPFGARAATYSNLTFDPWTGDLATQTLTKVGSPYLILSCANQTVPAGNTLTIEAGAVVKFGPVRGCGLPAQLLVYGNLVVRGTAAEPVIFTSWSDDSVAGDTNGDGSASAPQPGDWARLQLGASAASSSSIEHAVFRYGGDAALGMLQVWSPIGSLRLDNLEIASSSSYGLTTFVPLGVHQSRFHDNRGAAVNADPSFGAILPQVDATNNWWGDASGPTVASNPSGHGDKIIGNVLYDPWIGKQSKPDPVIIIPGILGSAQKNGVWVIDPIFHTYDDLIDTLKANGYVAGQDLFTFPYDWREGNVTSSLLLRDKIKAVRGVCQCAKVDLVAHSMGGLVARAYIQSANYEGDVDQLIFLGTPHLGAPESYLTWEGGEIEPSTLSFLEKFILSREANKAGFANLFDYVRNKPILSTQELLPIYDYLRDKSTGNLRSYPNNYPKNTFLESLDNQVDKLLNSGVKLTNIVGDAGASSTINSLRVVDLTSLPLWEHGYPDGFDGTTLDQGLEKGGGDATVPRQSSDFITSDLNKVAASHKELPSKAESFVFNKLTNRTASTLINKLRFPNLKILIIKLLSPVDMLVTAPDGKQLGKDFSTGQEINEIDNSFYSGFLTDNEYLTILNPLDGEYKIQTQGTGNGGEYTVAVGYISDALSAEQDFTAQTKPGLVTDLKLSVNSLEPQSLNIKPIDTTPPEIAITSPEAKDYLHSQVLPINVDVKDKESAVASQEIKFDDRIIHNGENIDLFFVKLGNHQVTVSVSDVFGNATSSVVSFRIIATPESAVSDINRAFTLGWITNNGIKESLIKKLQAVSRLEKRIEFLEEKLPGQPKVIKRIAKIVQKIDKILLAKILKELEAQHNKQINDQAYNLLKEDINWLLNN